MSVNAALQICSINTEAWCPVVFCKNVLLKSKIYKKAPVLESLSKKVAGCRLIKKRLRHRCFPLNLKIY